MDAVGDWLSVAWALVVCLSPAIFVLVVGLFLWHPHRGYPLGERIFVGTIILTALILAPILYWLYIITFGMKGL